jgi:hypothetical protein
MKRKTNLPRANVSGSPIAAIFPLNNMDQRSQQRRSHGLNTNSAQMKNYSKPISRGTARIRAQLTQNTDTQARLIAALTTDDLTLPDCLVYQIMRRRGRWH